MRQAKDRARRRAWGRGVAAWLLASMLWVLPAAAQPPAVYTVTDPARSEPLAAITVQWDPESGTGFDWQQLRRLTTDNRTPGNLVRLSVQYLQEAVEKMTGRSLEVRSGNDLSRGIVLTTYRGAPSALQRDPQVVAALRNSGEDAYNANEAFLIRSEPERLLLIANTPDGLNAAVTALLESVGYETLGMGKNWIHVPDFRQKPLTFAIELADRPSFYIRGLNPMGGQDRGRGTISSTPPHPEDESVRTSVLRWRTGFRLWGTSMPPYPGHALDSYHQAVVERMIATGTAEGFLVPKTVIGTEAERPPASEDSEGTLWLTPGTDEPKAYLSNGSRWVPQPLSGIKANLDLSVPLVRQIVLEEMLARAERFFEESPDGIFIFATDPEDGGGYAVLDRYVHDPSWYPAYRESLGEPLGQPYRLHGFRDLGQPEEAWDPASPSDHVFAFNSWLLREYDRWVDERPETRRRTSTGRDKKEQVRCSFYSYNYHDVPPQFNPDPRCRVMVAGYPKNRGRGKWLRFNDQLVVAAAFKQLLPREPSGDYRIISLADYWDSKMDGLAADWDAAPAALVEDLGGTYDAGIKSLMLEMDFNFGKNGLGYYLISKLLWDARLDVSQVDALRDRWLQRAYGGGWARMKAYYDFMLKRNYPSNSPGSWARAIRMIEEADALIDPRREPMAQRRLDDLKQFWYFYYLHDTGQTRQQTAAVREFLWKGQMSYITAMEMVIDFFPEVRSRKPEDAAGEFAQGPAHYTAEETRAWWEKVLAHWPLVDVDDFADASLADGTAGGAVDQHDLVAVREFRRSGDERRPYFKTPREPSSFFTLAPGAGAEIGFTLAWPFDRGDRDTFQRAVTYGVDRWDADAGAWRSIVDQTMTSALSRELAGAPGKAWQVVRVRLNAPAAGVYRFSLGSAGDARARVASLAYDPRSGDRDPGGLPKTYNITKQPIRGGGSAWFYIPKGTQSLDMELDWPREQRLTLHVGRPGPGMRPSRELVLSGDGTHRIPLNPGEDGTLASFEPISGDTFHMPYLYSVPMWWARSPDALLVPRAIAEADQLTPSGG